MLIYIYTYVYVGMERRHGVTGVYTYDRVRESSNRPGLRGQFMPRAFVCTRDRIGRIWFDDFGLAPLLREVLEKIIKIIIRIIIVCSNIMSDGKF